MFTPFEAVEFVKEMHLSILDKPFRKELSMYSRKGFKPSQKAKIQGFTTNLQLTYISWLMCVPGVSENKAIAIARTFQTYAQLMTFLKSPLSDVEKKKKLREIPLPATHGEKGKQLGNAVSQKVFHYFLSADPNT